MNIGLDYDDTFTRDPAGWAAFVNMMSNRGHSVYIVTWRFEGEEAKEVAASMQYWKVRDEGIFCTGRQAKEPFMYAQGIRIDVMIDDNPRSWIQTMEGH